MTVDEARVTAIRTQIQGNIVEPYRLPYVRHLVLRVIDAGAARRALAMLLRQPPTEGGITTAEASHPARVTGPFVNIGFTYLGLRALAVPSRFLEPFPTEFRQGMVARAARLGDVGTSGPEHWDVGMRSPDDVHMMVTLHGESSDTLGGVTDTVLSTVGRSCSTTATYDGEALVAAGPGAYTTYTEATVEARGADAYTHRRGEHFGFRDGLAQPQFAGFEADGKEPVPESRCSPLGVVVLGHPSGTPINAEVPPYPLGYQGSFAAFRMLGQDVAGFRKFVRQKAAAHGVGEELLKAKMCGRWPDGTPLARDAKEIDDFDFTDDQDGAVCPVGSHIRRANPRNAHIVQRPSNAARRLVRRGMPFGPWLNEADADDPEKADPRRRGLLGMFLCASLSSQFEATQFDWLNLGLQDPSITSTHDPIVGANDREHSRFTFCSGTDQWHTVRDLPRFVETLGGAYLFLPSMQALDWLVEAAWQR